MRLRRITRINRIINLRALRVLGFTLRLVQLNPVVKVTPQFHHLITLDAIWWVEAIP